MKARIGNIIVLIAIQVVTLGSQNLFVEGAEWYYTLSNFGSSNIDVNRCYIEGDTLIEDRSCLIYIQDHATCNGRPKRNYMYKENDKIYFFDQDDGSFKLLYDFTLDVGDTMIYETGIHSWDLRRRTHYIRIDAVKPFLVNSLELKSFDVTYGYLDNGEVIFGEYSAQIIEDIGNTYNFFHYSDGTGFCDDKYSEPLRCFSAPDFPTVEFSDIGCTTVPSNDLNAVEFEIRSYPNPFTEGVTIELHESIEGGHLYLFDYLGRIQYQQEWSSNGKSMNLNTTEIPLGIYWLQLEVESGHKKEIYGKRIMKSFE